MIILSRDYTYIAGDWDGDIDLIEKLYEWNNDKYFNLNFFDVHEVTQSRDDSLACSIKKSLKERMDISKTFVLIVGEKTNQITKGSCTFCGSYDSYHTSCHRYHTVDFRSFVKYECDIAVEAGIKIVVLYNSMLVNKDLCPPSLRSRGNHIPAIIYNKNVGSYYWNCDEIVKALSD